MFSPVPNFLRALVPIICRWSIGTRNCNFEPVVDFGYTQVMIIEFLEKTDREKREVVPKTCDVEVLKMRLLS